MRIVIELYIVLDVTIVRMNVVQKAKYPIPYYWEWEDFKKTSCPKEIESLRILQLEYRAFPNRDFAAIICIGAGTSIMPMDIGTATRLNPMRTTQTK